MFEMDNQADEEPSGPSVDSEDPEERILARRLRIQKRQEAQKKYVLTQLSSTSHPTAVTIITKFLWLLLVVSEIKRVILNTASDHKQDLGQRKGTKRYRKGTTKEIWDTAKNR